MLLIPSTTSDELKRCSDEELLLHYQQTSENRFFAEIFSRYVQLTYRTCLRYLHDIEESKDQAMHIFYKLLEHCRQKLLRLDNFRGWLFALIRNECLKHRRCSYKVEQEKEDLIQYINSSRAVDRIIIRGWNDACIFAPSRQEVRAAIRQLPETQRQCIHYFYFEKKSYRTIAQLMNCSEKKVKSCLQNGKRRIKKVLLEE